MCSEETEESICMASLRSILMNMWLRRTLKSKMETDLGADEMRTKLEAMAFLRLPKYGASIERIESPVRGEWHRSGKRGALTVLYLHGGGYIFGSPRSHRSITFELAKRIPASVFSLDYRLAPEDPYPAALEDAKEAYLWLLETGHRPESIIIAGDSAGGGLTLALLLACKAEQWRMPGAAILFSPWTDMTMSGASVTENERSDIIATVKTFHNPLRKYLGDTSPTDPFVSPLFGDLSGLPPIKTFASHGELLRDDASRLHKKLLQAGVQSELRLERHLVHAWPLFYPILPEAGRTLGQAAEFVQSHVKLT